MRKIIIILIAFSISYCIFSQPYIVEQLIFNLNQAVASTFLPNNNVIITHKSGPVRIYTLNNSLVSTFWNFTDSVYTNSECGVLGICLDPNFNSNHYIYIYYSNRTDSSIRVVRLTENNNLGTNPYIVFKHFRGTYWSGPQIGGNIRFGPLNKLYITIGDFGNGVFAQQLTTPRGKMLRINSDGTIPTDNPFYDDGNPATGNDDRIWALGLRNSFDFCFSPINDSLYATENGTNWKDELNFIRRGKNYGWPGCEGYCIPYNPFYKQPMAVFDCCPPIAGSIVATGVIIYNGALMPELNGKAIVAGLSFGNNNAIYKCILNASSDSVVFKDTLVHQKGITTLMQGTDDYIYALYYGNGTTGGLLRIKPDPNGINNNGIPVSFSLSQNYPNPFNPVTSIKYKIPKSSFVILKIYNVLGMEIKTLINDNKQAGSYEVSWDASNYSSGVYFYELQAGEYIDRKKMVLIK